MKLTPEQYELLPSDEDVNFYREHGYYISGKIFSSDEIDNAVYGSERFYSGERDFNLHHVLKGFEGWNPQHRTRLRINDYVSLQNQEIAELVHHPLLGAIASKLCGSQGIRLWHDQMIYKPTNDAEDINRIGWHTDRAYWMTCTSVNMLTAWIPFQHSTEMMGTLIVIDGSHKWSENARLRGFHNSDSEDFEKSFAIGGERAVRVPINLEKGQVSFHHCKTTHGSGLNLSGEPRLSLSVHLQDESNRYCEYRLENGELDWHPNHVLCRRANGQPDYTDPDICPTLGTS